jgi:hypothetical protein
MVLPKAALKALGQRDKNYMTTALQIVLDERTTDLATSVAGLPAPCILQPADLEKHAASLEDKELLEHVKSVLGGVRNTIQKNLPYLLEARNRFASPGQRVPVEGEPTWTEWVRDNLQVDVRTVQRWLATPKTKALQPAARKVKGLRPLEELRDWPAAQRKAYDLVLAVKTLKLTKPVGTDMLFEAVRELAEILGFKLMQK